MNHDKLIEESQKIMTEKLGKELKAHAKTEKRAIHPGDTTTLRTSFKYKTPELSPGAKAKKDSSQRRYHARAESDTYWAKDYQGGGDSEDRRVRATRERLGKHAQARGTKTKGKTKETKPKGSTEQRLNTVQISHLKRHGGGLGGDAATRSSTTKQIAQIYADKRGGDAKEYMDMARKKKAKAEATRGKANESLKSFNHFCEALKHVKGSNLPKALTKAEKQRKKSVQRQEALPSIDKYGNVDDKKWNKEENLQYRLGRATEEVRGETAKRLRKQGLRPVSNVSNIEREAEKAGDKLKPREPKPTHSRRLPSGVITQNQSSAKTKKIEGKTKELGTGK